MVSELKFFSLLTKLTWTAGKDISHWKYKIVNSLYNFLKYSFVLLSFSSSVYGILTPLKYFSNSFSVYS